MFEEKQIPLTACDTAMSRKESEVHKIRIFKVPCFVALTRCQYVIQNFAQLQHMSTFYIHTHTHTYTHTHTHTYSTQGVAEHSTLQTILH